VSNDPIIDAVTFVLRAEDGRTTLRVVGELDLSSLQALSGALDEAVQMTDCEMVVDLCDCPFLCSRSLGLIEASAFRLGERNARLLVRDQPPAFDLISSTVGTYVFDAV
jgi:anti-anti-sigma factor